MVSVEHFTHIEYLSIIHAALSKTNDQIGNTSFFIYQVCGISENPD